jgi:hypothetical protein
MAKSQTNALNEIRDPYSIKTDDGEMVNAQTASPSRIIRIHGHKIRIKDIPITAARLTCGHNVRGIAFSVGNLVYCDKHEENALLPTTVIEVI